MMAAIANINDIIVYEGDIIYYHLILSVGRNKYTVRRLISSSDLDEEFYFYFTTPHYVLKNKLTRLVLL